MKESVIMFTLSNIVKFSIMFWAIIFAKVVAPRRSAKKLFCKTSQNLKENSYGGASFLINLQILNLQLK